MKLRFAICIAALLAACSPAPATDGATADAGGATAKRMPLPDCSTAKAEDAGADGFKHTDCRLMFPDQSGMAIEARYTPAEDDSTKVVVQVVAPGDATLETIEAIMGNTLEPPKLEDLDKDGKTDILLPLETGMPNTTWAIYRQVADGKFVKIGEPDGVGISKTESGYFSSPGRSSANMWDVDFFKLDADQLKLVVTVEVTAKGEPDKITGVDCVVTEEEAFALSGLTSAQAKEQFCKEPSVAEIFK